jgi:uncharacterized membrane protein (DUF373 family)
MMVRFGVPVKDQLISRVELAVVTAMQVLLILLVITASVVLYLLFMRNLSSQATKIGSIAEMLPVMQQAFAGVLTVILGLELLETLKTYSVEHHVRLEVILVVAIIAVARHLLQVDFEHTPGTTLFGLAAVVFALTVGYFLVKKTHVIVTGVDEQKQ